MNGSKESKIFGRNSSQSRTYKCGGGTAEFSRLIPRNFSAYFATGFEMRAGHLGNLV